VPTPIRELAGFQRVHLGPAQTKTLHFAIQPHQLALFDDDGHWAIEPGTFEISVGGIQPTYEHLVSGHTQVLTETFAFTGPMTHIDELVD
jgi:beta-glucosidase